MQINMSDLSPEIAAYIKSLEDKNAELQAKVEEQDIRISNLTELIVKSQKKMFGKSSEQLRYMDGAEQLTIFNEAEQEYSAGATEPTKETLVASHTRKAKRTKAELTENLEHREMFCDIEDLYNLTYTLLFPKIESPPKSKPQVFIFGGDFCFIPR